MRFMETTKQGKLGSWDSCLNKKPSFCSRVEANHLTKYLSLGSILPLTVADALFPSTLPPSTSVVKDAVFSCPGQLNR